VNFIPFGQIVLSFYNLKTSRTLVFLYTCEFLYICLIEQLI